MSGSGWHPHLESALRLDLARLFRSKAIWPGCDTTGGWSWTNSYTGEKTASIGYRATLGNDSGALTLYYTLTDRDGERKSVEYAIRLWARPMRFGGQRWFMSCPHTGKPALKLYKFSGIEKFCHRTAIRPLPTYASQRVSGSDRINAQRWAIRRKLRDDFSDLFGEPFKPKWMRWRTFQRHLDRDNELATREMPYLARFLGLDEAGALMGKKRG